MNTIQKLAIVFFMVLISMMTIVAYLFASNITLIENWDNVREQYFNRLILACQIVIGLIVILSILYLGKFHDYSKDMIKLEVELNETIIKFKNKFPIRNWQIAEETNSVAENANKQLDKNLKILNDFPRFQILFILFQVGLVSWILITASMNEYDAKQKEKAKRILQNKIPEFFCP